MEAQATARYVRISPLKARRVAREIRGRPVAEAQAVLKFLPHRRNKAQALNRLTKL